MASITIRNLDDDVKTRLRMRAAENGRSMEEEARVILRQAVGREKCPRRVWARRSTSCSSPSAASSLSYRRASRCANRPDSIEAVAMVLLNTNVVSELMLASPNPEVLAWMDDLPSVELFVTAVTEAEIRTGVAFLPEGARRRGLLDAVERILGGLLADRVLPFDSAAARAYADIAAARRAVGRPISQPDCQIAAIALARGMSVATRNVRDFSETGVDVIDPWTGV